MQNGEVTPLTHCTGIQSALQGTGGGSPPFHSPEPEYTSRTSMLRIHRRILTFIYKHNKSEWGNSQPCVLLGQLVKRAWAGSSQRVTGYTARMACRLSSRVWQAGLLDCVWHTRRTVASSIVGTYAYRVESYGPSPCTMTLDPAPTVPG